MEMFVAVLLLCCNLDFGVLQLTDNIDLLFKHYAESDLHMDRTEFDRLWFHTYDANDDGNITRLEFDSEWLHGQYGTAMHAPLFFLGLDRVQDEVINVRDLDHIFRVFDQDGNFLIDTREFSFNWNGLFNLSS